MNFSVSDIWVFWRFVIVTSKWRHTLKFFIKLNLGPKNMPHAKFKLDQVIILKIIQVFLFFSTQNDVTHWKQKVAMATSYCNDY